MPLTPADYLDAADNGGPATEFELQVPYSVALAAVALALADGGREVARVREEARVEKNRILLQQALRNARADVHEVSLSA